MIFTTDATLGAHKVDGIAHNVRRAEQQCSFNGQLQVHDNFHCSEERFGVEFTWSKWAAAFEREQNPIASHHNQIAMLSAFLFNC